MDRSIGSAQDELCISENGRIGRKRGNNKEGNEPYKSKNLFAERNRREKLHNKLMELRGMVPVITNMKKATIVEDAIAYVKNLEEMVNDLKDQLSDTDQASFEDGTELNNGLVIYAKEEFNELRIEPDISLIQISEKKLWIKAVFEKKQGGFTRLMEALSALGFEVTDTNLTTSNELMLVTSSVEGYACGSLALQEMKELLTEIVRRPLDLILAHN